MKDNKLRKILKEGGTSVATRICSTWPTIFEAAASTGNFDYIEFVAEYSPYDLMQMENITRACELHNTGTIIKVDFQNRGYVAQRAIACGFHGVLFTDHRTAKEVEESMKLMLPETPEYRGYQGFPNNRWIGYQAHLPQTEHAKMVEDVVKLFMIEKKEAMDNIEEICSVPGIDMLQFGPSDYSMSCGFNYSDHVKEVRKEEERMIRVALEHNIQPRVEIDTLEQAKHYQEMGVRHFCVSDEFRALFSVWNGSCRDVKEFAKGM